jgi:hypothetical protein
VSFGDSGDLGGQPHRQDHQRLTAIGADDQEIVALRPIIESAKSAAAAFDLDAAIDAEQRHGTGAFEG